MAQATTEHEAITITSPTGGNVIDLLRLATDRAERALERGDLRAARKAFEAIRKYSVQASRAREAR
jgi:hypothetical protein